MKLNCDPATDSLYIELTDTPSAESQEVAEGLIVDFDHTGRVVGLDLQHAKANFDLTRLDTSTLPIEPSAR